MSAGRRRFAAEFRKLSDAERERSREETMRAATGAVWVFAYGSLMWNPCFRYREQAQVTLPGHRRSFCIWTARARGTPQQPGLGLGLLEASSHDCVGVAYRLDERSIEAGVAALWTREMHTGIYRPTWVRALGADGPIDVLAFVVDRSHPQFAGEMPPQAMAEIVVGARGVYGTCRDYVANTVDQLGRLGVRDRDIEQLLSLVDGRDAPQA